MDKVGPTVHSIERLPLRGGRRNPPWLVGVSHKLSVYVIWAILWGDSEILNRTVGTI